MYFSKFFSQLQEAPWYRQFLTPVLNEIADHSKVMDIGTGTGKMLEILYMEKKADCYGTDTSLKMLDEAREKLKNKKVILHHSRPDLLFPEGSSDFDNITYCNVLFHLKNEQIDQLLDASIPLLKGNGKTIILTPTGENNLIILGKHFLSIKNLGVFIWYMATKKSALQWTKEGYIKEYSQIRKLKYERRIVMNGFAQLEILYK